ncbi:thioredoxin-like protein [Aspergillus filifer]
MDKLSDEDALNSAIANNPSFILMFTAPWSDVGRQTKANFERLSSSLSYRSKHRLQWGFTAIPATVGYKNGAKVDYSNGSMVLDEQVERFIQKIL